MSFEHLINQSATEKELYELLRNAVQADFFKNQDKLYFFKLQKVDDKHSRVAWLKIFDNRKEFDDQRWSTGYEQASMLVFFRPRGSYQVICKGFFIRAGAEVFQDRVDFEEVRNLTGDIETQKMIPRELVEAAFGEFRQMVATNKRRGAA